jgi:hypothetical protein
VIQRIPPSRAIRAHLRTRAIGSVIPEPGDQKAHRKRIGSSGGRPVTYDRTAHRGRNVIECAFNFKHWRGLATRDDEHAIVYRGGLVLAAVLPWLTDSGDTSWERWHQLGLSSAAGAKRVANPGRSIPDLTGVPDGRPVGRAGSPGRGAASSSATSKTAPTSSRSR